MKETWYVVIARSEASKGAERDSQAKSIAALDTEMDASRFIKMKQKLHPTWRMWVVERVFTSRLNIIGGGK